VIAPPYDVISPEEQQRLYDASPHNVVRLIYGKPHAGDTKRENRYTRAREALARWRREEVLIRDEAPAIYLYEHAFGWDGALRRRLGVVARLEFAGSVPGGVLRHESTFSEPKADRARLLDEVKANLSPVFGILPDPGLRLHGRLAAYARANAPLASAQAPQSHDRESAGQAGAVEEVRLWAIRDAALAEAFRGHAAGVPMLIADGHHRFEVALSRRQLALGVMTHLSLLEDPALVIRPIHRVMRVPAQRKALWRATLEELCELRPAGSLEQVIRWLSGETAQGRFGYYEASRAYEAAVRPAVLGGWLAAPSVPGPMAGLDVIVLHQLLLARLAGAAAEADAAGSETLSLCRYTPEPSRAVAMVRDGQGECAWLLRPTPIAKVYELAAQGLTLPQKSTYFYPKVLSGLLINPFDASELPAISTRP